MPGLFVGLIYMECQNVRDLDLIELGPVILYLF